MPMPWIKGLMTWLSGLVVAVLMLVGSSIASSGPDAVSALDNAQGNELPGISASLTQTERTV